MHWKKSIRCTMKLENKQLQHIPVIAVTASAMKTSEDEISLLCDGFLRKPFKMEDLMILLLKYLKHS